MAARPSSYKLKRQTKAQWLRPACTAFLCVVLLPAAAIFCLQWNSRPVPEAGGYAGAFDKPGPISKDPNSPGAWISSFIRRSGAGNRLAGIPASNAADPFRMAGSRPMISAQGDAFLAAMVLGVSEGPLVIKGRSDGIPLLGPSFPRGAGTRISDLEILKGLQSGVGGSFGSFFAGLFGQTQQHESSVTSEKATEENPFAKDVAALAESNAVAETPAAQTSSEQDKTQEKVASTDSKESTEAVPVGAGPASQPIANLLLNVGDNGALQAVPVESTGDGRFASAALGIQDTPLLTFQNAPDFGGNISVADFNGDGYPDVAYFTPFQGLLRFYYGDPDGSFTEGLRVDIGRALHVMTAGDFNHDGQMDLAVSLVGANVVTMLYGDSGSYRFKSMYLDTYWDYILAADTTGTGTLDLLGMSYSDTGTVLLDFSQPGGVFSGRNFDYTPSLNETLPNNGRTSRVSAVVLAYNLSLNLDDHLNRLTHVLNILAGTKAYVVVGDLLQNGRLSVGIGIPTP